jgi:hypothetical protein
MDTICSPGERRRRRSRRVMARRWRRRMAFADPGMIAPLEAREEAFRG